MNTIKFNNKGEILIAASKSSSQNDFDFLVGYHSVHHKKLKLNRINSKEWREFDGTHNMFKVLIGIGNIETHNMVNEEGEPTEGMAVRLFNPSTRLWSIYWAKSETGAMDETPVVGSFDGKLGHFYAKDKLNGKDIILQFEWDRTDENRPVWKQAFSVDNGKTWEWNWFMYFIKDDKANKSTAARIVQPSEGNQDSFDKENYNIVNPVPTKLHLKINEDLDIKASGTSSKNDYDFLIGKHFVHHEMLASRLMKNNEWLKAEGTKETFKILQGMGNIELHHFIRPDNSVNEGMALRLFNPSTKLWSLYWADDKTGILDKPLVGSFDGSVGTFFSRDVYNGKPIIVQFQYDKTKPERPTWAQAFSIDNGKTWEWNWYMYYSSADKAELKTSAVNQNVEVIEMRNYLMRPGQRDTFINYFEDNFVQSQNSLGGYILGQYRIKGEDDHFFWMRGFQDMQARNKFLNDFYFSPFWKEHKHVPNSLLLNNDNVYLLKPLNLNSSSNNAATSFDTNWFATEKGIAVVDFYISNSKLEKLIEFTRKKYIEILQSSGAKYNSFWTSELTANEFTALPVFQDKNLLVQISFYKNELEYQTILSKVDAKMNDELKTEMADLVTIKNTIIIYPTTRSFSLQKQ
ncbi:MAG: hypothetical protein ABIN36_11970 [Ferruginibacter sp.]